MKDILIVSNYYPPEKGAAANRIEQMALKLQQKGYSVSVVCPLGNYPNGRLFPQYRNKFSATENQSGIRVKRLWIYPSNSDNVFKRLLSIKSFSVMLFCYLLFAKTPQKVIVQSPPLVLSFIAVLVLSLKKKKIILNVSDLWPLAAVELKALKSGSFSHKILLALEKLIYQRADIVLGQSDEIIAHVKTITPRKECYLYRNYPEHQLAPPQPEEHREIRIFYAGLLGVAQGIYDLCKNIILPDGMELHIFGDGAEAQKITDYLQKNPKKKILSHGMLARKELLERLRDYDIAVVPLKTRIFGSVPSKIFEYATLGFPILYFGGGEGEDIVHKNNLGWVVKVGDYDELNNTLSEIPLTGMVSLKQRVLENSKSFNLNDQVDSLIERGVF